LGNKASPSLIALADASKHIIQIVQLLEERRMSFSFCVNKDELLTLCGLSLLYQGIDLKQEGKLMKDNQKLISAVVKYLEKSDATGAHDFKKLARSFFAVESPSKVLSRRSSDNSMAAPTSIKSKVSPSHVGQYGQQNFHYNMNISHSETDLLKLERLRRATMPHIAVAGLPMVDQVMNHSRSEPAISPREYRTPVPQVQRIGNVRSTLSPTAKKQNLDYLSLGNTPVSSQPQSPAISRRHPPHSVPNSFSNTPHISSASKSTTVTPSEWETLLGTIDGGQVNIYDAMYGGPQLSLAETLNTATSTVSPALHNDTWSPESWDMTSLSMHDYAINPAEAQSVLSFSEESLSSGEELSDPGSRSLHGSVDMNHVLAAGNVVDDGFLLAELDSSFAF
jgi:hypothetical protein